MQQIADWLEKLGMSEYAQCFAENRIDVSVLPDLTDQDLEKLGVLLGDRRKMLRAIANLEAVDAPIAVVTTAPATPRSVDTAERRQVTVMFSDLVGSTALSAPHGPGRPARSHFGLPEVRRRDRSALRRLRCEVHGRRRPHLLWLSAGP